MSLKQNRTAAASYKGHAGHDLNTERACNVILTCLRTDWGETLVCWLNELR